MTLFFDGTMNNRYNVAVGKMGLIPKEVTDRHKASYENNYSNVSRLESAFVPVGAPYDQHFRLYIEGIGTTDLQEDSTYIGGGLGMGVTGIPKKVEKALRWALEQLLTMPSSKDFEYIHIDTFGFSRGAAAARHCVAEMLSGENAIKPQLVARGYTVLALEARFVGLFDTVASYGVIHSNDTTDLVLDAIGNARQTVQIAAAEEHRENFALTSIESAAGDSFELFLPGVHSDIGGGYNANTRETLRLWEGSGSLMRGEGQTRADAEANWLADQGWFPHSLLSIGSMPNGPYTSNYWVDGDRIVRSFEYCLIPLKFMTEYAGEQGLKFANLERTTDPFLGQVEGTLRSYAIQARNAVRAKRKNMCGIAGGPSSPDDWFHVIRDDLKRLRGHYFHFSAHYDFGMHPRFVGTRRTREVFYG